MPIPVFPAVIFEKPGISHSILGFSEMYCAQLAGEEVASLRTPVFGLACPSFCA